ncbi:hypothetical protein TNCV_1518821 [Trichonephila clavipes]|nr:hypothetical protein TNCV_1518821 [Trichonephila clavipes]
MSSSWGGVEVRRVGCWFKCRSRCLIVVQNYEVCRQNLWCLLENTQGISETDLVTLNNGQVTRVTSVLPLSPNFHTTSMEERLSINVFNVPLHWGLQRYYARTQDMSATSPLP